MVCESLKGLVVQVNTEQRENKQSVIDTDSYV